MPVLMRCFLFLLLMVFPLVDGNMHAQDLQGKDGHSQEVGVSRRKAQAFYYETRLKIDSLGQEDRLASLDSLVSIYRDLGQADNLFRISKELISCLQDNGAVLEALQYCRAYLSQQEEEPEWNHADSLRFIEIKIKTGALSISAGLYDEGASHMLEVLKMDLPSWCATQAYSYLGYIFMRNNRPEKSMEYHRKALHAYESLPEDSIKRNQCSLVFNHLAGLYYDQKQYDSAIACLERAISCTEERSVKRLYSYHNMALIYMELQEYGKAEEYLRKTVVLASREKVSYLQAAALQNLASMYKEQGRDSDAAALFRQAIDLSQRMHFNDILSESMIGFAELLFDMGDCPGFRDYYMAGVALRDSVTGAINQERIDMLNFQHESYRLESERMLLEQNLKLTSLSNQKKTVVVVSLCVLLFVVTLYMGRLVLKLRRQARENVSISTERDHIRQEMEKQETESRSLLNSSMEMKNRELASRALYMVQMNDILQKTLSVLDEVEKSSQDEERKRLLGQLRSDIRSFNGNINGWKDFRVYFEQIHQDFYKKMLAAVPGLTPIEQRLCALLVSNLTQKEIAEITNRSVRTVETMIYRIRKKFQVPSEVKMSSYLQRFL